MKKIIYCLFFISNSLYSQVPSLDSLRKEIEGSNKQDTSYVDLLINYSIEVMRNNPSDTITMFEAGNEATKHAKKIEYLNGQIKALEIIGTIYQGFRNEPLKALEYYQKALILAKGNPISARIHINIGLIYYNNGDFDKALEVFRKILTNYDDNLRRSIEINIETYLASVFGEMEQLDSSIYYFQKAIDLSNREGNKNVLTDINSLSGLAITLTKAERVGEAIPYLERALKLVGEQNPSYLTPGLYAIASEIYTKSGDYNSAEYYIKSSKEIWGGRFDPVMKKIIHESSYLIYKAKKDFKGALDELEKFKLLNDSLTAIDQRIEFTKKDLAFESERKELIAQAEISRQKLINRTYLIVGFVLLIVFGLISFLIMQKRKMAAKTKETEFKKNLAESKLIALRTQLNPHFIFNALNSIDQYMISHGTEQASNYLVKFSMLMRKILENSTEDWITLSEEMELMRLYVGIEALRLKKPLEMNLEIEKNIDIENTIVPSLFIQPFIENSIEHGISKINEQGKINLIINIDKDEMLNCTVEDNGIGRGGKSINSNENKSMGMQIAKDRIAYFNYLTDNQANFNIEDLLQGVRVSISIPHKTKF